MPHFHLLELWIDYQNKVVSFCKIPAWAHLQYQTEESMVEHLERLIAEHFLFQ